MSHLALYRVETNLGSRIIKRQNTFNYLTKANDFLYPKNALNPIPSTRASFRGRGGETFLSAFLRTTGEEEKEEKERCGTHTIPPKKKQPPKRKIGHPHFSFPRKRRTTPHFSPPPPRLIARNRFAPEEIAKRERGKEKAPIFP